MSSPFDYEFNRINKQECTQGENKAVIAAGACAFLLALVKFTAGLFSGSVAVLGSAIDSMLDFIVSLLNLFALRKSRKQADERFNFGYTKLEALAALFECAIIVAAAGYIFYESVKKFSEPNLEIDLGLSLGVMVFSVVVTLCLVLFLNQISKKSGNLIIKADALHYKIDLFSNLAVIISLLIIKFSGFVMIDAIFGIVISGYIAQSAINLGKDAFGILLDHAASPEVTDEIIKMIKAKQRISDFHYLNTRQSANTIFLTLHLVFDKDISLYDAHEVADSLEAEIREKFKDYSWQITTHLDPYNDKEGKRDESSITSTRI
ncbi:cation diffusion facilitator family transporter [Campylobacter concisus]|uniref:cation diffusion facilitator family transporter n=1 Tax=Campylobacter concisus TaxID=199 RepID=UPI000CD92804|nr:cation diffusion facilitator family transporter [Campylobacter concisus]